MVRINKFVRIGLIIYYSSSVYVTWHTCRRIKNYSKASGPDDQDQHHNDMTSLTEPDLYPIGDLGLELVKGNIRHYDQMTMTNTTMT